MSDPSGLSISLSKLNHKQTISKRFFTILKNQLNSSRVSIISTISLIRSRLDISNLLSTKKSQADSSARLFCFQHDDSLLVGVMETKKPLPRAVWLAFLCQALHNRITRNEVTSNPPLVNLTLNPSPRGKGLNIWHL